jgi:hypothetical protein
MHRFTARCPVNYCNNIHKSQQTFAGRFEWGKTAVNVSGKEKFLYSPSSATQLFPTRFDKKKCVAFDSYKEKTTSL